MATRLTLSSATRATCGIALLFASCAASAQTPSTQLAPVTISGRSPPTAGVAGFGDVPLSNAPLQASVYSAEQLQDAGVQRLSDLTRIDPALSDAYNSEGYIDYLTVRGFVLDNRFNFRRDGLPINAETSIPLDNKARIEILKGTSGIQAGTSSPGGLVNYIVKRPLDTPLSSALLEWRQTGSVLGAVDLSQRFGTDGAFGVRLNAAAEHLDPRLRDARGNRQLFALAGDWRLGSGTVIEAEVERSHRSQPSQPAFSLLGDGVPAPVDPLINLNNQPWSQPVVFDGTTASLRIQQRLGADWKVIAHAATQRLRTDDRLAFPFGCFAPDPLPDGTYYADRYCPDGSFDLYDYRSENERRRIDALDVSLHGRFTTGALGHSLSTGVLRSIVRNRVQAYAYNFAGTGNVDGPAVTPSAPDATTQGTNRDERTTELYLRDAIALTKRLTTWIGLRHSRLDRQSVSTDGTAATAYRQSLTTPWVAAGFALTTDHLLYASWGQGVESEVAPNLPRYTNAGQPLPALKSRQVELGLKGASDMLSWSVAAFDTVRPLFVDVGTCDVDASCTHVRDGQARHRGLEATAQVQQGSWTLDGGAQWLRARLEDSQDPALNGLRPTNVPALAVKTQAAYKVASIPGLRLHGGGVYEGPRMVLPDNSISIPGYARFDVGLRYERQVGGNAWTLRAGIDNLFDRRAWKESPFQFSHAYLYPLAARTVRVSLQVDL